MSKILKGLTRLHSLDAAEVSLVPRGANRRRFLITKSAEPMDTEKTEIEKGGPGSGPRKGGGSGGEKKKPEEKIRAEAAANAAAGKDVLARTQSGREIKASGNKGEKNWTGQDHMDAWHAHHEAGMHHYDEMRKNPSFTAAREIDPHMMRTPEQAAAIARDPAVRASQAKANEHHAIAEAHYQNAKKKGVAKSAGEGDCADSMADKIKKADPEKLERVEECVKAFQALPAKIEKDGEMVDNPDATGLDDEAMTAVKAVARILIPFQEKLSPALIHQVLDAVGYQMNGETDEALERADVEQEDGLDDDMEEMEKGFMAIPAKVESEKDDVLDEETQVKKGDFYGAVEEAQKSYKTHLEKLGYRKYPDAVMAMKSGYEPNKNKEGEKVTKSATDLSGLDAKAREKVEAIFKAHDERQKELIAKNADLEARIAKGEAENRKKEIVAKAASFGNLGLPVDDVVAQLEVADKAGKDAYERVCKNFDTLNNQARSSKLFSEVGTSARGGSEAHDAMAKIEVLAAGIVQKSATGMTKEQAFDMAIQTPEGQRLYAEHKAARGGI